MESAITFIYSDCNQTIMTDAVKEMEQYLIHFVTLVVNLSLWNENMSSGLESDRFVCPTGHFRKRLKGGHLL